MQLTFLTDTSCGTFGSTNAQLRLHIFASKKEHLPPLKRVGDFIFLHNVQISEWKGDYFLDVYILCNRIKFLQFNVYVY